MNKKMFIICVVLFLISSCKNDESKEEKSLDNILDDIGLEVEKLVQADDAPKKAGNKDGGGGAGAGGAGAGAGGAGAGAGGAGAVAGGGGAVAAGGGARDNIKKQIAELKAKIDKADPKKTSLTTYSTYEGEVKKLREALKGNGNGGNDAELNQLEGSLKKKKDDRKKELEDSKKKFEELKTQVGAATGRTQGDQARNRGRIGVQASQYAQALGLNVNTAKYSNDTSALVKHVIEEAIRKIDKELKE